ncbi:HAAS signaling domain-containing protein [Oceanobacillus manasiensis]|uniref:HAAS signaling domain-containing protein n=1 Tax=Oceanobacillus manasiensis TaxID=586413 RepID=UPI0005A86D17|nr:DUF1700 domain-containing protein [Oceanobacillus manasiensis]
MNKTIFIKKLEKALEKLPPEEQQDVLEDFREHFHAGLQEGKEEEEIANALGSPNQIAKEIIATYYLDRVEEKSNVGNIFRAVWAVIGLGFFNLIIVLGPFIALLGCIVGGWAVGIAFVCSPILLLLDFMFYPDSFRLFDLFASIALTGLGIFITIAMFYVTRFIAKVFVRYLSYNAKLVKGGLKHA